MFEDILSDCMVLHFYSSYLYKIFYLSDIKMGDVEELLEETEVEIFEELYFYVENLKASFSKDFKLEFLGNFFNESEKLLQAKP